MKLFAVVLGGRAQGCNVELHDVVFVTGETLEETYPKLVNKWFGHTKRLHIDSTRELKFIDGHEIILSREKAGKTAKKLYFVNFGGYRPQYFGEIHEARFYVAANKNEALMRAKKDLGLGLEEAHCDDNLDVDDIMPLENVDQLYLHLQPTDKSEPDDVASFYRRLDVPEIIAKAGGHTRK